MLKMLKLKLTIQSDSNCYMIEITVWLKKLNQILKVQTLKVNSIHHQAINKLGDNLEVSARSSDGIIEGIETTNNWDAIGVQWHPEYISEDKASNDLFDWLIN